MASFCCRMKYGSTSCRPFVSSTFGCCAAGSAATRWASTRRSLLLGSSSPSPNTGPNTSRTPGAAGSASIIERSTAPEKLAQPAYRSGRERPRNSAP